MSLFEKCVYSATNHKLPTDADPGTSLLLGGNTDTHITVPTFIRRDVATSLRCTIFPMQRTIFYISDLHLVHHILSHFSGDVTDEEVHGFLHNIVLDLFKGEFGDAVRAFDSPIVLFGGDTSSCFSVGELFYQDFISTWENIVDEKYSFCCNELDSLNRELNEVSKIYSEWAEKHSWVQNAQKSIEEYSDKRIPRKIKEQYMRGELLKKQLKKKREELGIGELWESDYQTSRSHPFIYAILGNHELWDFDSYDSCIEAYDLLFKKCGIQFMCDKIDWLGSHFLPFRKEDNPEKYDRQMLCFNNFLIVGGIGFSGMNSSYNADQGIYGTAINREEELARCEAWRALYHKAYVAAKEIHSSLVVFTHMPISDWGEQLEENANSIFINGHTHRNISYVGENNNFILADNQVGYDGKSFQFKKAILHLPRNPFASDCDGFREISCAEYEEYYRFVQDTIPKTGTIFRQINQYNAKLFVIKQNGYVGFFLISPKGVFICNGGQIRKVGVSETLDRYYLNFKTMIDKYITALMPLRRTQEKLSAYIQSFGGSGKIHGTIVDINYSNHVMVDTSNGTIIPYNSPMFGIVKTYSDIGELLHVHCPELEEGFLAIESGQLTLISSEMSDSQYEQVDIQNSPYALSRRVNALQRLFDKQILRDWNPAMEEV